MASKVTAKAVGGKEKPAAKGRKAKAEAAENSKGDWERFPKPDPRQVALAINMRFGNNGPIIRPANEAWNAFDLRRPNGIPSIDLATGGGLPAGGVCQIDGPESCLDGESFIPYEVWTSSGDRINHKGGSIKHLYERFHDQVLAGTPNQGRHLERKDGIVFYVKSVDDEGKIVRNLVLDVVHAGMRPCFEVETDLGQFLISTGEHKYLTPTGFKALADLKVGDQVMVHNNYRVRSKKKYTSRPETMVAYHPLLPTKIVHDHKSENDYLYYRGQNARLAYEAFMNKMEFNDYIKFLNSETKSEIEKLKFLPQNVHVHHKDEDFTNNNLTNLQLIDPSEHGKLHSQDRLRNLSFISVPATITRKTEVCERDTYDLRCEYPYNNYVAAGFVVHNSGKNYLLYRYFAEVQRNYGDKACLAMACFENFVDKHFAQMCGVKVPMSEYDIEVTQRARKLRGEEPLTKNEVEEAINCPGVGEFHIFEGPSEGVLDGIVYAVEHNIYQTIGIDSWDMMLTGPEDVANLDETPQVASPAMLQTRWSKKILDALNPIFRCPGCGRAPLDKKVTDGTKLSYKYVCPNCDWKGLDPHVEVNETTIIAIRQSRAKLNLGGGKTYGRAYDSKGAYALQHVNLIRLSLFPGAPIKLKDTKIGKEINWEITKGKSGTHEGATGNFSLYFDPLEVDTDGDLLAQCLKHGVILKKEGARFVIPEIDLEPLHGEDKILQLIGNEPDLVRTLKELLYVHAGLSHARLK